MPQVYESFQCTLQFVQIQIQIYHKYKYKCKYKVSQIHKYHNCMHQIVVITAHSG